ncbi:uncharacterized protein BP5553_09510 [Venustampulla echinocandica]|uniref:YDG domain-containing protein n=1 Tax=Venustampulla echinocandica TaxID=2656787 RepID=A0A370TCX5_9HELO|nr:uncharacterized protein BP5553_09510 [Venustampulla echinocandica]RDL32108.1 hypothetical protein BP5553_09510 [Venustampulla echinocandica]
MIPSGMSRQSHFDAAPSKSEVSNLPTTQEPNRWVTAKEVFKYPRFMAKRFPSILTVNYGPGRVQRSIPTANSAKMDQAIAPETSKTGEVDGGNEGSNNNKASPHQTPWEMPKVDDPAAPTLRLRRDSMDSDRTITPATIKTGQAEEGNEGLTRNVDDAANSSLNRDQEQIIAPSAPKLGEVDGGKAGFYHTMAPRLGELPRGRNSTNSSPSIGRRLKGVLPQLPSWILNNMEFEEYGFDDFDDFFDNQAVGYPTCYSGCPCENTFPSRGEWDRRTQDHYHKLVDLYRATLKTHGINLQEIKAIAVLLNGLLEMERDEKLSFWLLLERIKDVIYTRLDKLLEDILKADFACFTQVSGWSRGKFEDGIAILTQEVIPMARRLQMKWQHEYNDRYFDIDKVRCKDMQLNGALHHVAFNPEHKQDGNLFIIRELSSTLESPLNAKTWGNQGFKVGRWYLNIWCAARDGMVGNPANIATEESPGEVTALALLTGTEVDGSTPGTYEYTLESPAQDINFSMLTQGGRPIRLLRGHLLKSKYAPAAGIRFDGLYTLSGDGHRIIDEGTNSCRLILTLTQYAQSTSRYPGPNPPHAELNLIPRPSQLDEWKLYNDLLVKWNEAQEAADTETPTAATVFQVKSPVDREVEMED